ncbi:translation initiation factor IF-3 [Enterobacteriaceae endosymbiont of Macroplea appendiculata]|nr:translation initiation factor IF-3 [Enterobacteriaceae endosymbiont of Macroplea appendiculata]
MKIVKKKTSLTHPNKINEEIIGDKVRLIGINGEQIGIIKFEHALIKAKSVGFDLVEINAGAVPPVCRIMNYGKFLYIKNKTFKEQKRKQKIIHLKEIKFRPGTDIGDYNVKLRHAKRFLKQGDKIKVTLRFRGREMMHVQIGLTILYRVKNDLQNLAMVETFPTKIENRQMIMILIPKKK